MKFLSKNWGATIASTNTNKSKYGKLAFLKIQQYQPECGKQWSSPYIKGEKQRMSYRVQKSVETWEIGQKHIDR